ncbi:SPOR domain-containing protein [Bacillus sp. EB600]|uniref:SPOR domain-containing protein n=1 Tax=Bacillus sp. EB600 TaxID=2806345 RepID=UPI00210DA098|nr:SPOR domain-containing protein [Bacillus sp. EB600]MCQ6278262.1 SPOR domain-containing protein [Bacillus sp. EB600]
MNKLNSGKTITIKINGEKTPFLEKNPKEEQATIEHKLNSIEINSVQTDNDAIVETAATQEQNDESFDWILPEQAETQSELSLYKSPAKASKQKKSIRLPALSKVERKNTGPFKPIILSVVFAVLLGTSFGVLMLKLVITDHGKSSAVEAPAVPAPKKDSPINDSKSQVAATIQPLKAYMIQGGVFTKKETADQMASQTIKKGIPAETLEMNGQYYLFLGAADSLDNARSLGTIYKHKGIDGVFTKTVTIPEKNLSNLTSSEKSFMENALAIIALLTNLTSNKMAGGTFPSTELKSLSGLETKLTKIDSKGIKDKKIIALKLEITRAINQVKDYQQKKDHKAIVNAQQHLLTFLAVYYSL